MKSNAKYAGCRETNNKYNSINDFYEIIGDFGLEQKLLGFFYRS